MVAWIKQSLKKLNEEKRKEQEYREQLAEIQDALIEVAGLAVLALNKEGGEGDG